MIKMAPFEPFDRVIVRNFHVFGFRNRQNGVNWRLLKLFRTANYCRFIQHFDFNKKRAPPNREAPFALLTLRFKIFNRPLFASRASSDTHSLMSLLPMSAYCSR
jgi:hypothetical protein